MEKQLSQIVFEKIKNEQVKPTPRWGFLFKNYVIWGISFFFMIIGSLSFSVVIHMIKNSDWDLYKQASNSILAFIFATLPYFWILLLFVFIAFVLYNIKHTRHGYRYRASFLVVGLIAVSMFFGSILFASGVGKVIDEAFSSNFEVYNHIMKQQRMVWVNPENGVLAGIVLSIKDDDSFVLEDFKGMKWEIVCDKEVVRRGLSIKEGMPAKIIGLKTDDSIFMAREIRSRMNMGAGMNGQGCRGVNACINK